MSKFKPNKNVKFDRKLIGRGERALYKLKLKNAEQKMVTEIEFKLHSAKNAFAYFIYTKDYASIETLCEGIKTFATDKWMGYIDPTIWTKKEHKYLEEQFEVEIKFGTKGEALGLKSDEFDNNLNFDADAFTNVEFIKQEGQKEIKYWVLTECPIMDGYNDPMTSKYFDPADLVAGKLAFETLIVRVKRDIEMNQAYVQTQKAIFANL